MTFGAASGALSTGALEEMQFTFQRITLMSGGSLEMAAVDAKYTLNVDSLVINSAGQLIGRNLTVFAKSVTVEESGKISLDAQGERCPSTDINLAGSGGSHAGELFYLSLNPSIEKSNSRLRWDFSLTVGDHESWKGLKEFIKSQTILLRS